MAAKPTTKLTKMAPALAVFAIALGWAATAQAFDVPPYRGNDTGGIVAYEYSKTIDVHQLIADHCAQYNKVARITGVDARYGGYISFTCSWARPVIVSRQVVVRTLY